MDNESGTPVTDPVPPGEPAAPAPEGPENPLTRLFGVLVSPGETFESIGRKPDWLIPLLVWIAISIAGTMVVMPRLDYEPMYRSMLERNSQLTEKQREQQLDRMMEGAELGEKWGVYAPVLTVPLMFLVVGTVFWGALRAFGAENSFRQSLSVTIYAFTPQLLKAITSTAIASTRTTIDARLANALLKSNLGAFLTSPTESPVMFALLGSVDLFTIWTIVLLAIGLSVISKFPAGKVAILVVVLYLVVVLVKVGFAALMGGFS
ncbi:MAG: YIP1 family protein [Acidobacteria bacterium]|nr:YIP1 family protein [Acidobacteriota bacterium]